MKFRQYLHRISLLLFIAIFTIIVRKPIAVEAGSATYSVYNLSKSGNDISFGKRLLKTSSFSKAKKEMEKYKDGVITSDKGLSPLKIVAASRGQAQSYPYRKGKDKAANTLKIYDNKNLTSNSTYLPAHYMLYVYGYEEEGGRIVADVEIQGGKGYVEVDKLDIVPMIYIENGIKIKLGGKGSFNSDSKKTYTVVPHQEEYRLDKNGGLNVKAVRPYPGLGDVNLSYGRAPGFMSSGKIYYSPDGIRFFSDRELKNRVGQDYYAYFQWLPLRSVTNHQPKSFDNFLKNLGKNKSVMLGENHHFIQQGKIYGMNPVLIFQQANLESAYGTSKYARERNNIFGWGAVDSDPDKAYTYEDIGEGIEIHMKSQIADYMDSGHWKHYGPAFGNKSAGFTVKYASDPYYGPKVASLYYRMDRLNDNKDYNHHKLSLLEAGKRYVVKDETGKEWYKTKAGLENQIIINLEKEKGRIKTIPWLTNSEGTLDIDSEFAYIEDKDSTIVDIDKNGLVKGPKYKKGMDAVTTSNLNLRREHNSKSQRLATIPKGTKIIVNPTDKGWGWTNYGGKAGFVSMDYVKKVNYQKPPSSSYMLGDVNGDGVIDGFDMMEIKRHYLDIKKLTGSQFKAADVNKDGVVDGFDMMDIKRHYLGIKQIKE